MLHRMDVTERERTEKEVAKVREGCCFFLILFFYVLFFSFLELSRLFIFFQTQFFLTLTQEILRENNFHSNSFHEIQVFRVMLRSGFHSHHSMSALWKNEKFTHIFPSNQFMYSKVNLTEFQRKTVSQCGKTRNFDKN